MFKNSYLNFVFSLIVVLITGALCSWFNRVGMASFYEQIEKSPLTPPNIVFPIVWTILYILLVLAFDIILNIHEKPIMPAVWLFIGNMILQILWCWAFFNNGQFLIALIILMILDIATAILVSQFYKLDKAAGWLLAPYMLWVLFATYLNWEVVALNGNVFTY